MAYEEILTKSTGVSTEASQGLTDTQKANARSNIGAGTSSLAIGTTSTTAAAGNHTHTYASLTSKPTISRGQVKMTTGVHSTVTAPFTVTNSANLFIYKDGLLLAPTENYTISGNVVTLVGFSAYLNDVFDFIEFKI